MSKTNQKKYKRPNWKVGSLLKAKVPVGTIEFFEPVHHTGEETNEENDVYVFLGFFNLDQVERMSKCPRFLETIKSYSALIDKKNGAAFLSNRGIYFLLGSFPYSVYEDCNKYFVNVQ